MSIKQRLFFILSWLNLISITRLSRKSDDICYSGQGVFVPTREKLSILLVLLANAIEKWALAVTRLIHLGQELEVPTGRIAMGDIPTGSCGVTQSSAMRALDPHLGSIELPSLLLQYSLSPLSSHGFLKAFQQNMSPGLASFRIKHALSARNSYFLDIRSVA
ncbi:hypothetical protein F4777DRAFT_183584 [Nemania sp. FL0916]|nr:hypothetical protein F4777DRAFT_183584 [Nemania sp. FL0916]